MAIGIPAFGLSIPLLTGLYGSLTPGEPAFWIGGVAFVALAAAIWLGNRWLLLQQRRHLDWFEQPARKLMMLVAANVLYTAPLTIAWISAWYLLRGLPVDWPALQVVTLTNVICVVFVTHAYETVFLIRERESDMMRVERLERMRVEGELAALTSQIDPHFLFNSLNTLGHVIAHDPVQARDFCDRLAEVYRYVLASRGRQLVSLQEELDFVANYYALLALRFGPAIELVVEPARSGRCRLAHPAAGAADPARERGQAQPLRFVLRRSACGCRGSAAPSASRTSEGRAAAPGRAPASASPTSTSVAACSPAAASTSSAPAASSR